MKKIFSLIFITISLTVVSQPYRYGYQYNGSLYKSNTDTAAWLSQLRQYEPKISPSSTSYYWRGDKTWQAIDKYTIGLGNVLNVTQEPALGNPSINGYVLSSTISGVRSCVAAPFGDYMLKYAGQAHQDNMLSSGIYFGLDNPGGGTDDFTTFSAWATNKGFQLESYDDAGYVGGYSTLQRFYMRSYNYRNTIWRSWLRLLTEDDLNTLNTNITNIQTNLSNATGTFQGSLSNVQSGFTINDYTLRRHGNIVCLTIRFNNGGHANATTEYYLCDLPVGYRPTSIVYGVTSYEYVTDSEHGTISANPIGSLSVRCGKTNNFYVANLTWIILNP
jgi:hypothetical protein